MKAVHALFETTLLDISAYPPNDNSPYQALSKAATLRCAIYNENRRGFRALPMPEKPKPVTKEEQRGGEFKDRKSVV